MKSGLGAINPNIDCKNLEVLKYLYELAETHLAKNKDYQKYREVTRAMALQALIKFSNHESTFNFRHDGIYVSMSIERAAIYTAVTPYGSEILERCLLIYSLLKKNDVEFEIASSINLFHIERFLNTKPTPIIIKVLKASDEDLEFENNTIEGLSASVELDRIRHILPQMTEKERFEYLQFKNLKLLKPIPTEHLKFYEMEFEGNPKNQDFCFELTEIKSR